MSGARALAIGALTAVVAGAGAAGAVVPGFPSDNGLSPITAKFSKPAYIGTPTVVTAVAVNSANPIKAANGVQRYRVTVRWNRAARDDGSRRFLLTRAPSSSALCGFFASLFTKARAAKIRSACKSQGKPDLNVYALLDYRIAWRGPLPGGDERWWTNTKDRGDWDDDDRAPLTAVGKRAVSEPLLTPLEPGRYEIRLDTRVRLDASHPLFEVADGLEFVEDYLETPLEFLAGPATWLAGTIKDEALETMFTTAFDRISGTRSAWSFEVPAVVPSVTGKTPQGARNLLRLHRLDPVGTATPRAGTTTPSVIGQGIQPGTKLHAWTKVPFTFITPVAGSTPPAARPGPWHGDWRWTYTPAGGAAATPGVMTMFQPSPTKVCLRWPWSRFADGRYGNGSGTTSAGARTFTFKHADAFGSGTHTVTLSADGKSLTGTYTAKASADGAQAKGAVSAVYLGPPGAKLSC